MPEQRNNSNTLYIVLGVIAFFGLSVFACCGFMGFKMYSGTKSVITSIQKMSELVSNDAADIKKNTNEITDINIPVIFSPKMRSKLSMADTSKNEIKELGDFEEMANDISKGPFCVTVLYRGTGGNVSSLQLAGFVDPPYTINDEEKQAKFLENTIDYLYIQPPKVNPQPNTTQPNATQPDTPTPKHHEHTIEKLERNIRGEKVTFHLHAEGGTSAAKPKYRILEGSFPGKHGPAKILLRVDATKMTRDEIIRMVDSIQ